MDDIIFALTLISALGCGLVAGWFFAFSNHILKSLGRLPEPQGIAAMQVINVVVINPWTMTALFGSTLTCITLAALALLEWNEPEVYYQLAGSGLYVLGTAIVTIMFNVPRNDALATVDPASGEGAEVWRRYLTEWTLWNHVRTAAALGAAALLAIALTAM